jgi:signal peptidase I
MEKKSSTRELVESIIIALVLALIIRTFVVQAFKIPSGSMLNTLLIGDQILVNKFIYKFKEPQRGDIIVFKYPRDERKDFVKRLIGLSGEKIEIVNNQVYINGRPLKEPYAIFQGIPGAKENYGPRIIPKGYLFVMGDNRYNSADSREWGFLDRNKLKGKAFMIYWSWDPNKGWLDIWQSIRWKRIGKIFRNPFHKETPSSASKVPAISPAA